MSAEPGVVEVDARGTRCPMPVILAAHAARELPPGTHLLVLATDPAAAADLPAWCRIRGHQVQALTTDPDGAIQAHLILGPSRQDGNPAQAGEPLARPDQGRPGHGSDLRAPRMTPPRPVRPGRGNQVG